MRILLALIALVSFVTSLLIFNSATGALHEIEALILLVVFAVTLSGAGIIEAINIKK